MCFPSWMVPVNFCFKKNACLHQYSANGQLIFLMIPGRNISVGAPLSLLIFALWFKVSILTWQCAAQTECTANPVRLESLGVVPALAPASQDSPGIILAMQGFDVPEMTASVGFRLNINQLPLSEVGTFDQNRTMFRKQGWYDMPCSPIHP